MTKLLIKSLTKNIKKTLDLMLIWSMFMTVENKNMFYVICGYVLYFIADICINEQKNIKHRPEGRITLDDWSQVRFEKYH